MTKIGKIEYKKKKMKERGACIDLFSFARLTRDKQIYNQHNFKHAEGSSRLPHEEWRLNFQKIIFEKQFLKFQRNREIDGCFIFII